MTFGGDLDRDLVGDLGGEKATMEVGLGFGLLHGARRVLDRGVTVLAPWRLVRLGELKPACSLGISNDMRPSPLLPSSATASLLLGAGERCRGVVGFGAGALFALNMFSNLARRSDTGFCHELLAELVACVMPPYNRGAIGVFLVVFHGCSVLTSSSAGTRRYPICVHRPSRRSSH